MKQRLDITYPSIQDSSVEGTLDVLISIPFEHLNHSFHLQIPKSLYEGAKAASKKALIPSGIGDAWLPGYYRSFIEDRKQIPFFTALLKPFRAIRKEQGLDSDRYLELLTAYVQGLPYDHEKTASLDIAPRFPVETAADKKGICSDKSLLLAGMLSIEGYACAILHFGPEHHAAVGIPAPSGYDFRKTGYAVIETTVVSYIGSEPCTPEGMREIKRPKVIPVGCGTKTYSAIRDTAKILAVTRDLAEKLNPEGTLASELKRLQTSITEQTENLRMVKAELESPDISFERDRELRPEARSQVLTLQQTIRQYNALAGEFSDAQKLAAFIHTNRLDRKTVMRDILEKKEK